MNEAVEEVAVRKASGEVLPLVLRSLRADEYGLCEELQRVTWGSDFSELVPASMMMITRKLGGVVAGAFDPDGRLVGMILGLTGVRDSGLLHWSHMAAVHPDLRGCGVGRCLKLLQRRLLLALDVDVVEWTYDPLEARNAHLNLSRLGAVPVEYQRDVYGDGSTSGLHSGIGTDRLVVRWLLRSPRVEAAVAGRPPELSGDLRGAEILNVDGAGRPRTDFELGAAACLRIAVPADIQALKAADLEEAKAWRGATRRAFETAFAAGFAVRGLLRDEKNRRSCYALAVDSR